METPVRKVITASAGTGKTYRLSLEFINLLLQYRNQDIGFDEILVITFTRKATSEIRSAIFKHLNNLLAGNKEGSILQDNLKEIYGIKTGDSELKYLKNIYEQMLVNKHRLQISTIDSFVHGIFKAVIAPYAGITDFRIDNEINRQYLPDIYNHIFKDNNDSAAFIRIFRTAGKNTIEHYDRLILSIIDNRWLFHLIKESKKSSGNELTQTGTETNKGYDTDGFAATKGTAEDPAAQYLALFHKLCEEILEILKENFHNSGKLYLPAKKSIMADSCKIVSNDDCITFLNDFRHLLHKESFLKKNWKKLSGKFRFWKKTAISDTVLKDYLEELGGNAKQAFSGYVFYTYLLAEEQEILLLSEHILKEYDRLKMRDKIFTYSDIAYYTFKYLYDPALSMIDPLNGSVSNRFYEYLSARTRFMLIDEFQDTGIIQHKLLFPIISEIISGSGSKEYGGVIVVGDEKQSIYGWRNGERELLLNMPLILQTEDAASLDTTYRSSQFITRFINRVFAGLSQELQANDLAWCYSGNIRSHSQSEEGFLGFYFLNTSKSIPAVEEENTVDQYRYFVENTIRPIYEREEIDPAGSVVLARDNKQLKGISEILEEYGIDYFLESSFSFLQHQSIKPVMHLLRFLNEQDILYLLRFLRSDVCLLPAEELKEVALLYREAQAADFSLIMHPCLRSNEEGEKHAGHCHSLYQTGFIELLKERFPENKTLQKTVKVIENSHDTDPVELITFIIKEFNITGHFPEEHNIKNLHLFLEIVSQFLSGNRIDYPKNLTGLLSFLAENEKNEDFQQANIDNINSLQLMTVHKAKGLEFDNVFMFYDLSSRSGGDLGKLQYLYRFNEYFTGLEEYRICYNYSMLLKNMSYPLHSRQEEKDLLEEINNIYVALTRARTNIFLFMAYQNKDGLFSAAEPRKEDIETGKVNVKKLFLKTVINYLELDAATMNESGETSQRLIRKETGDLIQVRERKPATAGKGISDISSLIDLERRRNLKQPEEKDDLYLNFKTVYLDNKQSVFGDLAHYYLSFVKYGKEKELRYAGKRVFSKYGNLVSEEKIRQITGKLRLFIEKNKQYYTSNWHMVFTEKTIFDDRGREYRIDRMLVDEEKRIIMLIDYKTGVIKQKEQLARYRDIIAGMPYVRESDYRIKTRYLEIEL